MAAPQIYVLSSDESLIKNDRSEEILASAHQALPDAPLLLFTQSDFASSGKANLRALENELLDPGLFGGDRIIKIYLSDLKATSLEVLYLLAAKMRPGVIVIVDLPRILSALNKVKPRAYPESERKAKLSAERVFAYLKYVNAQIELSYPPEGANLYRYINDRALKYQISLSPEACDYFSKACEGNLTLIDQTLKILALSPQTHAITLDEAVAILDADSRFESLELAEAILNGDSTKALLVLNSAVATLNNPESILLSQLASLDKLFSATSALRQKPQSFRTYPEKMQFFAPYGIKSPKSMDAVIKAALKMPPQLFDYLIAKFAEASKALCVHDCNHALLALSESCACVNNFQVMNLKALWKKELVS